MPNPQAAESITPPSSETVVSISNLVKRYGEVVAVDHLSLDIARGELFGLVGPNGSGKTTTINCLLQLLDYDHGQIKVFGEPMRPDSYDIKRKIGIVPQEVAVFDELTVRENVDSFCALYVPQSSRRRELVDRAIEFVGLQKFQGFRPKKLSGGLLRRLNIACGIAHQPSLIIMDEPTVAVDPQSRNSILDGIERLNREGTTIIYTSHYMEEVERLCRRVLIMDHGRSVASGTPDELKALIGTGERISVETGAVSEAAVESVRMLPHVRSVEFTEGMLHVQCSNGAHNLSEVLGTLAREHVDYGRVLSEPPTLNDVFLEITGRELRDES